MVRQRLMHLQLGKKSYYKQGFKMENKAPSVNLNEILADLDAHKIFLNELLQKNLSLHKQLLLSNSSVSQLEQLVLRTEQSCAEDKAEIEKLKKELEALQLQINSDVSLALTPDDLQCEAA